MQELSRLERAGRDYLEYIRSEDYSADRARKYRDEIYDAAFCALFTKEEIEEIINR
jgi:hypothetical protein